MGAGEPPYPSNSTGALPRGCTFTFPLLFLRSSPVAEPQYLGWCGEKVPAYHCSGEEISELITTSSYHYLGIEKLIDTCRIQCRRRLEEKYLARVKQVWSSQLSAKEKMKAHNSWAVVLLQYYIGVRSSMTALNRKTRAVLRACECHEMAVVVERLYLGRKSDGRGLATCSLNGKRQFSPK